MVIVSLIWKESFSKYHSCKTPFASKPLKGWTAL
jgi:hypothetical protein